VHVVEVLRRREVAGVLDERAVRSAQILKSSNTGGRRALGPQLLDPGRRREVRQRIARDLDDGVFWIGTTSSFIAWNRSRYARESGVFQPKCQMALCGCVGGGVFTFVKSRRGPLTVRTATSPLNVVLTDVVKTFV
jgi:hypothetical protein